MTLPIKPIKYWLTTTNSSTSRASVSNRATVERRRVARPFFVAFAFGLALLGLGLIATGCAGSDEVVAAAADDPQAPQDYDLQGHRGARGLRPENTLPGFEVALDQLVDTLEFDLHLSADDVVIVWHDPVLDADICAFDGVPPAIRQLTAVQLSEITCDRNPDPGRFPDQIAAPSAIAGTNYTLSTLDDVFAFVDAYATSDDKTEAQQANAAMVRFNIETKRKPDDPSAIGDGFDGETVGIFEMAVIEAAITAGVLDRITIQSFDHRSLWAVEAARPGLSLAALTRRGDTADFAELARRGAAIWSPDHRSVTQAALQDAHAAGLLVIPWTVNDTADMAELIDLGVDGIITDRPDLAPPR